AQSDPEIEPTGQEPETSAPDSDAGTPADEPDSQQSTDGGHTSPEAVTQDGEKSSPYGDQGTESDKKAPESENGETVQHLDPSDRRSDPTREEDEPGKELTPQDENTTEVEEPSRFAGRVTILVDSDGKPIPERRHTETDDPNRGELRHPEDDRFSRDYQARAPERRSRRRDFLREFVTRADDTRDAADAVSKPAQRGLERVQPTGQSSGARPGPDQAGPREQPVKAGSALIGGVGMAIVLTEAIRYGIRSAKGMMEREHAGNR
uniref:hypothetical protein n=1 Tax=Saccharomonospora sp. TaxID=33913 RepID=UPI0026145C29